MLRLEFAKRILVLRARLGQSSRGGGKLIPQLGEGNLVLVFDASKERIDFRFLDLQRIFVGGLERLHLLQVLSLSGFERLGQLLLATLQLLPPLVTAQDVRAFLLESLRAPVFDTRVVRNVTKAREDQVARRLMVLQSKRVRITDSRMSVLSPYSF